MEKKKEVRGSHGRKEERERRVREAEGMHKR